jgi:hypothetical protein
VWLNSVFDSPFAGHGRPFEMGSSIRAWLERGAGTTPDCAWSLATESPLVDMAFGVETGRTVAVDTGGSIYLIDRAGNLIASERFDDAPVAAACTDVLDGVIAVAAARTLYLLDSQLGREKQLDLPEEISVVAVEPHGRYVAAALVDGSVHLFDWTGASFHTDSLKHQLIGLRFLHQRPALVGIAEHGFLIGLNWGGGTFFREQLPGAPGDLSISGDDQRILCACFSFGLGCYTQQGQPLGVYQLPGTVGRVSVSFSGNRIAAASVERDLFWIEETGNVLWQGPMPGEIIRLACDPDDASVVCGFSAGHILRLTWQ